MNDRKPEYFVPALIGGVAVGVLSVTPFLNCLCCLWAIGGAVLAAGILASRTDTNLTVGDGAIVGSLTGILAAVVLTILQMTPLQEMNARIGQRLVQRMAELSNQALPSWWDPQSLRLHGFSPARFILGLFISAAVFAALGVLGGVIGASLFGRKKTPPSPPVMPAPQGPANAT